MMSTTPVFSLDNLNPDTVTWYIRRVQTIERQKKLKMFYNVLSKFVSLHWASFIATLGLS